MSINDQIDHYINSQDEPKRTEMADLHARIIKIAPEAALWYLDGKNGEGKVVSNPNIGYGSYTIKYADGSNREFYQVGLSGNKTGISVYIMGIDDKTYLSKTFGEKLGKATVTGYCIKFKKLTDINIDVLEAAIRFGFQAQR